MANKARAYTEEEVRDMFLNHLHGLVKYWAELKRNQAVFPGPEYTIEERLDGLVFSLLNIFDGTNGFWCAIDLRLVPHPDDRLFNKSEGRMWFAPGMPLSRNVSLHDLWYDNPETAKMLEEKIMKILPKFFEELNKEE